MEGIVSTSTETLDVIRSWKDPRYRRSLSAQQIQKLPEHPAGPAVLSEQELKVASGIWNEDGFSVPGTTAPECTLYTFHSWKSCGC